MGQKKGRSRSKKRRRVPAAPTRTKPPRPAAKRKTSVGKSKRSLQLEQAAVARPVRRARPRTTAKRAAAPARRRRRAAALQPPRRNAGATLAQALNETLERLSLAAAGADDGLWDWKLETNEIYLSPRWKEVLGYEDHELPSELDTWVSRVHPDDRKRLATELQAHANGKIPHFQNVHRLLHHDGRYCWVLARGLAVRDPNGHPIRIAGSLRDISAQKEAERQLTHAAADARAILRALPDLFFRLDRNGVILDFHAPREADLHVGPEVFMGRRIQDVLTPEAARAFSEAIERVVKSRQLTQLEYALPVGGETRRFEGRLVPVHEGHIVLIARDITDRVRAQEALVARAQQQAAVVALGQLALEGVALSSLMEETARVVARVLRASHSSVFEVVPDGSALLLRAGVGWNPELLGRLTLPAQHPWQTGFAVLNAAPPAVADRAAGEQRVGAAELFLEHGIRSSASVPIPGHDGPVGALGVHATEPHAFGDDAAHFLRSIANVVAAAISRKRSEENAAALLDVARVVSGTLDLDQLLERVGRRTLSVLHCDVVLAAYWDETRRVLRTASQHGLPPPARADARNLELRDAPFLERLRSGSTVAINDLSPKERDAAPFLRELDIGSLVAVPLRVRGHEIGAFIALRGRAHRPFDLGQVEIFEGIARQLAVAVEGAELYRAQEEEAEVSFALARVGREMMASLNTPELLNRLCQLNTQALDCDFSHTWLWQPEDGVFVPVAGWGDRPEQWEAMRVVRVPREVVARLVAALEKNEVVQLNLSEPQDLLPAGLWQQYGITSCMYVALRRGGELVGILTSGYFGRTGAFTSKQLRIGRGAGQLTSLALANARLFEELERANDLKSDFVATMSHELRTPLNVILGYIELLLDGLFGKLTEEQEDTTRRIGRNARELLDLINATLDLSRLESGRVSVDLAELNVAELIEEVEHEMQDLHRKPEVAFRWAVAGPLGGVVTDRTKLKVVLKNLINNALKFTSRGEVCVSVRPQDDGVEFAVSDTGIGIAPEVQSAIFEPFRQADRSIMGRFGGVGLGLYIVRRLLDMIGGRIALESELEKGSTFRVWVAGDPRRPDKV